VGTWDAGTGYNDLGATIVISGSAPKDPGELPEGIGNVQGDKGQCTKVIENGIMYIEMPDGIQYTINGTKK